VTKVTVRSSSDVPSSYSIRFKHTIPKYTQYTLHSPSTAHDVDDGKSDSGGSGSVEVECESNSKDSRDETRR